MTKFHRNLPTPLGSKSLIDAVFGDFDNFFNSMFPDFSLIEFEKNIEGYPVANVYTNVDGDLKFEIAVTGFNENEVSATIQDGLLVIKAERQDKDEDVWRLIGGRLKNKSFEKKYRISNRLDTDKVSASIKNGVLEVLIKAKEETKPKTIAIDFQK